MIKMKCLIAGCLIIFVNLPAKAQDVCGAMYPADPAALAAAWLPRFERLYAAIPPLSPKEEEWLQRELAGGTPERFSRAIHSAEYAIQNAKVDVGGLLASMRGVQKYGKQEQTRYWLSFAYTLIEINSGSYIARLVQDGVIPVEAIPEEWTLFSKYEPLKNSIRNRRTDLARHVIICTLPAITGTMITD